MRLAIATGTGPADWGLEPDADTIVSFEYELAQAQGAVARRRQVVPGG